VGSWCHLSRSAVAATSLLSAAQNECPMTGAKAWSQVRVEFKRALALRSEIRRAGWFNRGGQAMMRLRRRASLLVAFFLLTSAATAHAECALVLWDGISFIPSFRVKTPGLA
jgi:hypothetical protein